MTTGKVDLTTSTLVSGSKSQVIVGDATATIASESSAEVMNDLRADQHEILVNGEDNVVGSWDGPRLERVVENLVSNAIKYTPEAGRVVLPT